MSKVEMSLGERWAEVKRNRTPRYRPRGEVEAGRGAEMMLASTLESRLGRSAHGYWLGPRVPDKRGHRHEIDAVVAVPDELWAVELKYWSGKVGLEGDRVVQYRSGGRGMVDHGPLLAKLQRRERALQRYLEERVEEVPLIWTVLVFAGGQLELDPALRESKGLDVVRWPEFVGALPEPASKGGIGQLFGEKGEEKSFGKSMKAAVEVLDELGTWDLLWLNGGRILSGDLKGASVQRLVERESYRRMRIEAPRRIRDLFRPALSIEVEADRRQGEEVERWEMPLEGWVEFKAAGTSRGERFELRDVRGVVFGSSGGR